MRSRSNVKPTDGLDIRLASSKTTPPCRFRNSRRQVGNTAAWACMVASKSSAQTGCSEGYVAKKGSYGGDPPQPAFGLHTRPLRNTEKDNTRVILYVAFRQSRGNLGREALPPQPVRKRSPQTSSARSPRDAVPTFMPDEPQEGDSTSQFARRPCAAFLGEEWRRGH